MSSGGDTPWPEPGKPHSYAPALYGRLMMHSQDVAVALTVYLEQIGQTLQTRQTYDGTDPTAKLVFILMEALLAMEQVRAEVEDQVLIKAAAGESTPAHILLVRHNMLVFEPALLQLASQALESQEAAWTP